MAFQFAHIQTYSRKGNKTNRSVAEICAEAGRVEGHHPHVAHPLPPALIAGDFLPEEVPEEIERRVAEAKQLLKGKTKATKKVITIATHVLEAQVYSHPVYVRPPPTDHEGEDRPCLENETDRAAYLDWRNATVEFVYREAERRGLDVLSIIEHLDEAHPHMHALLVPTNPQMNAKHSHPGHVEAKRAIDDASVRKLPQQELQAAAKGPAPSARARRRGGDSAKPLGRGAAGANVKTRNRKAVELTEGKILQRIGNKAYSAAMRTWQDLYNAEVGADAGLLRYGPRRFRWSREEYMQRRDDARVVAEARRAAKAAETRLNAADEKIRRSEHSIGPGSKFREQMEQLARDALGTVDEAKSKLAALEPELDSAAAKIDAAADADERLEQGLRDEDELKKRLDDLRAEAADLVLKIADSERVSAQLANTQIRVAEAEAGAKTARADETLARAREADAIAEAERRLSEASAKEAILTSREADLRAREETAIADRRRLDAELATAAASLGDAQAKAAGLNAWAEGHLVTKSDLFELSKEKRHLREQIAPVRDWLMQAILPVEKRIEQEIRGRVESYKETIKAALLRAMDSITSSWASGALRRTAEGEIFLKGPKGDREAFHETLQGWPGLTRAVFEKLPSLDKIAEAEKAAERLQGLLTQAEDRDARNKQAAFQRNRQGGFRQN